MYIVRPLRPSNVVVQHFVTTLTIKEKYLQKLCNRLQIMLIPKADNKQKGISIFGKKKSNRIAILQFFLVGYVL